MISGAAAGEAAEQGADLAFLVGREVAGHGGVVVTGATSGIPFDGARGAKSVGGTVLGFSPASTRAAHLRTYRLPTQAHDIIFYTGYEYSGRDTLMVDLVDAVIIVSGRMGTLHEFTSAFEARKITGVLLGSGGLSDEIPELIDKANRGPGKVLFDGDPVALVARVFARLRDEHAPLPH